MNSLQASYKDVGSPIDNWKSSKDQQNSCGKISFSDCSDQIAAFEEEGNIPRNQRCRISKANYTDRVFDDAKKVFNLGGALMRKISHCRSWGECLPSLFICEIY